MRNLFDRFFDVLPPRAAVSTDAAVNLQALRSHPRRALYVAGAVVSLLLLGALVWAMVLQARTYSGAQLHDFENGRSALQAHMARHAASQARLTNMTRFAWEHPLGSEQAVLHADLAAYRSEGQRLQVRFDEQSAAQTVLGLETEGWPEDALRRYLGLARMMSLNNRLVFSGENRNTVADSFFLDPTGHFVVLNHGLDEPSLMKGLGVHDREGLFNALRRYTNLVPPASPSDTVPLLRSSVGGRMPWLGLAAHPVTGKPSIVRSFPVRSGSRLIGMFVGFEPAGEVESALGQGVRGHLLVVAADGQVILGAGEDTDAAVVESLHEAGVWAHAHGKVTHYHRGARTFVAARVRGTDWSLVTSYDWRDILLSSKRLLMLALGVWAGLMALLWLLLVYIDRRVFAPGVERAGQIFASEQLSRSLIEMTPVGLCLVDIEVSRAVVQNELALHHARAAEAGGVDLYAQLVRLYLAASDSGQRSEVHEFPISHTVADGGRDCHLLVSARLASYEGRSVLMCALQDMTVRVELQEQQERLREEAEAACEAKSRFLATMSHEIRTPLHGILGHLELLGRSHMEPEQKVRLRRITQSADSLLLIINDVLDVSRIEAGQLDMDAVGFEPVALLERVALLYAPLAQAKGVDLDYNVDAALANRYRGAVTRMEQVLRNLVSNAVKFTQSGRIEIRVLADAEADRLRFEVADSGMGLSVLQQKRLFQPFTQADASIEGRFGGSGLGLSLCRQLCQLMGGEIEVRSTPGVGSVFAFSVQAQVQGGGQDGYRPLGGRQVFLASAVITWREELARRLRAWGADVVVSDSVSEAAAHPGMTVVLFERNLPIPAGQCAGPERPLVRVRADGPLRAVQRDGQWWVSCYAGQGLLDALQAYSAEPCAPAPAPAAARAYAAVAVAGIIR